MVKSRRSGPPDENPKKMVTHAIKDTSRQIQHVRRSKGTTVDATGCQKMDDKEKEMYGTKANDNYGINTKYYGKCHKSVEEEERDRKSGFASRLLPQHEFNINDWISEREEEKEENDVDSELESTATSLYNPN